MDTIPQRIASLRAAMKNAGVDACLIPSSDPHLSEYLPKRWQARRWLSGFTGSMGTLIVTADFAGVWADGRYWVQAEQELAGTGVSLMKIDTAASSQHLQWLADSLQAGQTLAVDGDVLGLAAAKALQAALEPRGIRIHASIDLIDAIDPNRAPLPDAAIYQHASEFAPETRAAKLARVREEMAKAGAARHFISTLDDIAWLFNLRGSDVSYNPVFIAHALIERDSATLFVGAGKIDADLAAELARDGVNIAAYAETKPTLRALPADGALLIDPRRITLGLRQAVAEGVKLIEAINPSTLMKSRKSAAEAAHVRQAMEQDGAALAEFFAWFEANVNQTRITELTIDEEITAARARRPGFVSPSFGTIAGFNANGALPHYHATQEAHSEIKGDGLLLIDSGGQYLGGTTDITRVVAVGAPSAEQKRDFTLVLKGTMALSMARFPRGTLSPMLDALARAPLWQHDIDFGHGTGHGVGYFLNVHEGPQSISRAIPEPHMAMQEGMITSIEPGVYRAGQWGVRIENLVLNVASEKNQFGDFLKFETLTLCPIDRRCIDRALLNQAEIDWLNHYHAEVRERLLPLTQGAAQAWLLANTETL
ncbi:aminopeptidase P family protein [Chromobacterium sp. IIBBL 290-4]|uniref:aminopeptidase P family protein n=1 Tax=Chromobacterium sp. IIBBL 290-4 TaxID=2953890 RepID=UPI0020B7A7FF|nr:aminopeptidase P family protein [Chromobacterium sp. IIBBL 290-4]UTH76807.1 aminopeptidase P family protein [Chromobacterium sp. IIBBL 290-4]